MTGHRCRFRDDALTVRVVCSCGWFSESRVGHEAGTAAAAAATEESFDHLAHVTTAGQGHGPLGPHAEFPDAFRRTA